MINDAMDSLELQKWKYVDDLSIREGRSSRAPSTIQNAVTEPSEWDDENHLHLNTAKCKQLQICFKHTPPEPPALNIGANTLDVVRETKILGVWLQDDIKWEKQVKEMMAKSKKRVHLLSRLKKFNIPLHDLVNIYKSYIWPSLEYATSLTNNTAN